MDESEWERREAAAIDRETRWHHGPNATLPHRDWERIADPTIEEFGRFNLALNNPQFRSKVISLGALAAATSPRFHSWERYKELLDEVIQYVQKHREAHDSSKQGE